MIRRDLKKFAQQLPDWEQQYHYISLQNYATKLSEQIKSFDIDNLPKTINAFSLIIQNLETMIH